MADLFCMVGSGPVFLSIYIFELTDFNAFFTWEIQT